MYDNIALSRTAIFISRQDPVIPDLLSVVNLVAFCLAMRFA